MTLLSLLAYGRSLSIPFISDDYLQIALGRQYGPLSGWPALLQDALYRCRATSILVTHWTELVLGVDPILFSVTTLAIHILNAMLVFGLGVWRPIGWRVSAIAACYFAVSQRHHEAVIWYAALPELLVFLFTVLTFMCWILWLQSSTRPRLAYCGALVCFLLALLSKESAVAVVPLMVFAVLLERAGWRALVRIVPFAFLSAAYFGMAFAARKTHLHFNDGTFSLSAPFILVLLHSAARLLWFWGAAALLVLAGWRARRWNRLMITAAVWLTLTLLPYCFLTYMPQVPSRHTYLASVGVAWAVAAALIELYQRGPICRRAIPFVVCALILHQCAYLWTHKQSQFVERAEPTEAVLRLVRDGRSPLHLKCFPYDPSVAMLAVQIRMPQSPEARVIYDPQDKDAVNLCTEPVR